MVDDIREADWDKFIHNLDEIIEETNKAGIDGKSGVMKFPQVLRPYSSTAFKQRVRDKANWVHWAGFPNQLNTFKEHYREFNELTVDNAYLADDDKIAEIINHAGIIGAHLTAHGDSDSSKDMMVVICGQQSSGLSSFLLFSFKLHLG